MKILKKQKEYPPLILQLAKAQFATGQIDLALVSFAKYGEQVPGDYRAYEGEGDVYAKQGVAPMAITQYEKSLELDSTQISIIYKLGNTYMSDRQYTEAARVFNKVLILQPDNDNARLDLAGLYFRAKLWWQCAHTLKDYIEKQNDAPRNLQTMYLEALYHGRLFKDGLAPAEKFLKTEPNYVFALRIVARAYSSPELKEYQKSIDALVKLTKIDTLQFDEYKLLGDASRQIKNDTLALASYLQAVKLDSVQVSLASLYGTIGSLYMSQRNWERAANYLELRVKIDTGIAGGYINLAACYQQMEKYEKAIDNLEKAISLSPEYPPTYVNMGFCYVAMKQFADSRKWFEKAVKVIDTMKTKYRIQLADADKMIGLSYLVEKKDYDNPNKKWEEGAKYLESALEYKEDDANSHVWLGQAYQNLQKKDEAIRHYKRALKLDPKNKDAKTGLDTLEPQ
jgi:tetratricopeptide (TPR) repeat protein